MRIKTIYLFSQGSAAVFDSHGQQMVEYQESWLLKFIEWMESQGAEIDFDACEIMLPHGKHAHIFQTESGRNWEVIP